jgi:hypothetical protein
MSFDPTEYIIQKLREYDPNLDTSPGTGIRDLLVNPFKSMLTTFYDSHQFVEQTLGLTSLSGISDATMENIASSFLVNRNYGTKAMGYVRIYFRDPRTITIPAGTEFLTTAGLKFYSTKSVTITATQMLANAERYPYYHTGDILVEAAEQGIKYQIGPEEIRSISNLGMTYNLVTNIASFTGAAERTTNADLYQKILDSAYNNALNSNKGIEKLLYNTFGSLENILVVGAGNPLMERDVIVDTTQPSYVDFYESDFRGKIFGQNFAPYVQSRAYYGSFIDIDSTNSGFITSEFPTPIDFSREFSQTQYSQIYYDDATITNITPSQVLLSEDFSSSGYAGSWVLSDEYVGYNNLVWSGEVRPVNGGLRFNDDPPTTYALIPEGVLALISGYLNAITINLPQDGQ